MQVQSVALTNVGLVRSMNQDAILEVKAHDVYLVADGMGGEKAGEEASAQVVATLRERFERFFRDAPTGPSQIEGEMRDGLLTANRDVFQISVREPEKRGLGSTASLLCLHRGVYFAAQVGDSRIYLLREGHVQQITRDHTLVWALYEQGAITREQLETHPDRHLLTQCIGNERPVKVDTFMGQIQTGDTFLICSDGLTGYAKEPRVFEVLKQEELDLRIRGELLTQAALDAGGGDNVSVILVRIDTLEPGDDWEPEATAPPAKFNEFDTANAFATSIHRPLEMDAPQSEPPAAKPWKIWAIVALLALAMVVAFIYFARPAQDSQVRIYLASGAEAPARIQVTAHLNGKEQPAQQIQSDAEGSFFVLPGPGDLQATLIAEGYLTPPALQFSIPATARTLRLKPIEWVLQPMLTLEMPETPPVNGLRILRENAAEPGADDIVYDQQQLAGAGRAIQVPLIPNVSYRVVAVANGYPDYVSPIQVLKAGQTRKLMIFFSGGPGQNP